MRPIINNKQQSCRTRNFVCILYLLPLLYFLYLPPAIAEHTRTWRQASYEDFLKGTPHGVAVRSDGRLELAPKFTLIADADASYLWSLRMDPKGALFAAGGSPAKVFRFEGNAASRPAAAGKPTTVFESTDLVAQAIAFDAKGTLYVATSPDGKVYRVSASGEKTIFFDPKSKYIWDLAFAADGTLYVATGDKGQVFAVSPDGKSQLFYASDEAHIRVLAFDTHNNLLAGTEPSGRILRVTRAENNTRKGKDSSSSGEGFVLYETGKREVTALTVAPDGAIYAAAIGEKQRPTPQAPTTVITTPQGTTTVTGGAVVLGGQPQGQTPFVPFPQQQLPSSIYRLSADGAPEELWSSRDEVVYSLALNSDGRLLAGTGNSGALLAIDGHGIFAQLAKAGSAQITGIARNSAGRLFLCTANPGKVFSVGPEFEPEGNYESRSFDAQLFSQWGRLDWWSPPSTSAEKNSGKSSAPPNAPRLEFFVRSGNTEDPGKEWSRWFGPYAKPGTSAECPPARFAQWKAVIHDGRSGDGISWVSLAYLPRNVAPVIDAIAVQDPGVRAQANLIIQTGQQPTVNLRQPQTSNPTGVVVTQTSPIRFEQPPQGFREKGYQSVIWSAHDDNEDELRFSVYFRGENESDWKLLKDKLEQKFYSWDSTAMPDGAYYLKIVATDAASNPPAQALTGERESERFVVDNTPPVIEGLKAAPGSADRSAAAVSIQFTARDTASSIERAQYSIDGGDWIIVMPKNGISDAPEEQYQFSFQVSPTIAPAAEHGASTEDAAPGSGHAAAGTEHTIAVRAYDRFDNVGSAKITVKLP
jgi:outer membrane protein assembly factor BamB